MIDKSIRMPRNDRYLQCPILPVLPLLSLADLLTRSEVGMNRVTSPSGFLIRGLASIVAKFFFFSSSPDCKVQYFRLRFRYFENLLYISIYKKLTLTKIFGPGNINKIILHLKAKYLLFFNAHKIFYL